MISLFCKYVGFGTDQKKALTLSGGVFTFKDFDHLKAWVKHQAEKGLGLMDAQVFEEVLSAPDIETDTLKMPCGKFSNKLTQELNEFLFVLAIGVAEHLSQSEKGALVVKIANLLEITPEECLLRIKEAYPEF